MMDFRILGPLEVLEGDVRLPLGKPRQRSLLAVLLLHRDEALSRERLVELVWGESPPQTVNAAVYNAVSQLRRSLGSGSLLGDGGGYRLVVEEGELDGERFESLLVRGRAALAEGAHELRRLERGASVLQREPRSSAVVALRVDTDAEPRAR